MKRRSLADPGLDAFRRGIVILVDGGEIVGYVATIVEPMWAPFRRQEQVWLLVSWSDGSRERIFEDYAPWTSVEELRRGRFVWESSRGDAELEARWLDGLQRERAWERYGIHDDVAAYLAPADTGNNGGTEGRDEVLPRAGGDPRPDSPSLPAATWMTRMRARRRKRREDRRARRSYGTCPVCGHDWREHDPASGCGECQYEIDHAEPDASPRRCQARAPGHTFGT